MRFRLTRAADVPRVMDLLEHNRRWNPDPAVLPVVAPLLRKLVGADGDFGASSVVFERSATAPLDAFGFGVFVHDAFLDQLLTHPQPYFHRAIYGSIAAGHAPLLTVREVANANARGALNMVALHYVQRIHEPMHDANAELRPLGAASFALNFSGYGLRSMLFETYGETNHRYLGGTGMPLLIDFADRADVQRMPPDHRPAWSMIKRGDPQCTGPAWAQFFSVPHPRLALTTAQRRTVLGALQGMTDREIAEVHGISIDAVRQTWDGVFDRCEGVLTGPADARAGAHRGPERRRKVMEYMSAHMAELRPYRAVENGVE